MKLHNDYTRCATKECIQRENCLRFTDKGTAEMMSYADFTPPVGGQCVHFISNVVR